MLVEVVPADAALHAVGDVERRKARRRRGDKQAPGPQHPSSLGDRELGPGEMLQHLAAEHLVEASITEGEALCILEAETDGPPEIAEVPPRLRELRRRVIRC